jgi:hypothetical protein
MKWDGKEGLYRKILQFTLAVIVQKMLLLFDCNACKALLCENINEKNESHILCCEKTYDKHNLLSNYNQIAFKNVISLNVGIVFIYMSDNFVKTLNETLDLQGNNLACRIEMRFRQTELIEHWIASDLCYGHRLLIVRLFISSIV